MRTRPIAAALLFSLLGQAFLPALAAPAYARAPRALPPECEAFMPPHAETEPSVAILLDGYLQASGTDCDGAFRSRIKGALFALWDDHPAFVEALLHIEKQSDRYPEAVRDLDLFLQLHWAADPRVRPVLRNHFLRLPRNKLLGSQIGAVAAPAVPLVVLGMIALSTAMARRPQHAARYFRLLRRALPTILASSAVGAMAGNRGAALLEEKQEHQDFADAGIPPSPAQILHLGLSDAPDLRGEEARQAQEERDALELEIDSTYTAVGAVATVGTILRLFSWVNRAAAPAKLNPFALIGSAVAGTVLELGIMGGIDLYEYNTPRVELYEISEAMKDAAARGKNAEAYARAGELARKIVDLTDLMRRKFMQKVNELNEDKDADPEAVRFLAADFVKSCRDVLEPGIGAIRSTGNGYVRYQAEALSTLLVYYRELADLADRKALGEAP